MTHNAHTQHQLAIFHALDPAEKAAMLERLEVEADVSPNPEKAELARQTLAALRGQIAFPAKERNLDLPTQAETNAAVLWLGKSLLKFGLTVIVAVWVLLTIGGFVVGLADGAHKFGKENAWIGGVVIGGCALLFLASGLFSGTKSEGQGGQTTHESFEQETFYQKTKWEKTTTNN